MNCLQKTSQEMRFPVLSSALLIVLLLAACGSPAPRPGASTGTIAQPLAISEKGNEVALYALGLIDTGYRFGGKNPEAGLDCSGMVSYIYGQAISLKVKGSAADIARSVSRLRAPSSTDGFAAPIDWTPTGTDCRIGPTARP